MRTKTILLITFAWLALVGLVLLNVFPWFPKSALEWILLFVIGPPLYVLGEAFFGWLFSEHHGKQVSESQFSAVRIVIGLGVMLAFIAAGLGLWFVLFR